MRTGAQGIARSWNSRPTTLADPQDSQYSKFVDRLNAQRFKAMVGKTSGECPELGLPFAIERPHVARAHRELEEKLKPAARRERRDFILNSSAYLPEFTAGSMLLAFAGFCGLICAYALQRSFK